MLLFIDYIGWVVKYYEFMGIFFYVLIDSDEKVIF